MTRGRKPLRSSRNWMAQRVDWTNTLFLAFGHLLALGAVLWLVLVEASPWTIGLGFLWFALCGVSITGGYHRLFAHPTYKAHPLLRLFYLVFGAAAVQNSALKWSADHRVHHVKTDRDEDPYNISRGFWWAHIGWVLHRDPPDTDLNHVKDLAADPLVRWQDRNYVILAFVFCGLLPLALGFLWGDPIGAVLVAGFLRLVAQWHATFAVNSFAHYIGTQPYSTRCSARLRSRPCAAMAAKVKRVASAPYWSMSSSGSMTLPLVLLIFWPFSSRTRACM